MKGRSPQVFSHVASLGLAIVLLALSAVTLWSVASTQTATNQVTVDVVAGNALGQAQYLVSLETAAQYDYSRNHVRRAVDRFYAAEGRFASSLSAMEREGSSSDQRLASTLLTDHQRYVAAFGRLVTAVRSHKAAVARGVASTQLNPALRVLRRELDGPAARARKGALNRLSELHTNESTVRTVTLLAFVFGLILVAMFWRVMDTFRRRIEAEERALEHQALHDSLTDLPNRTLLTDRIQQAVQRGRRESTPVCLLLMDLDRFKEINDTFGHQTGDRLLQQVGFLIRSVLRQSDTVARLGGDEFAVLLPNTNASGSDIAAKKLVEALSQPLFVEGQSFHVGVSIGIALFPEHGTDPSTLLRRADVAMYTAKRERTTHAVYSEEQDQDSYVRLALSRDLRYAVNRGELVLQFQPKIDMQSGEVTSVEALIRWKHPQRGMLFPDRFMVLAEQTGLVKPLSMWVLQEAIRQCKVWHEAGKRLSIAINLSASSIPDADLGDSIAYFLEGYEVPAEMLEIEVTESVLMSDPTRAMQVLTRLHDLGIKIAVDDFGTGYSSLAYLKRLPVDEIKIDKSFVLDMTTNSEDALIVRSIIDLGHNLGLRVVAEGVEDETTWSMLQDMGCDIVQGFYVSRPLTLADLTFWMSERGPEAASVPG